MQHSKAKLPGQTVVLQAVGHTSRFPGLRPHRPSGLGTFPIQMAGGGEKITGTSDGPGVERTVTILPTAQRSGLSHRGHLPARDTGKCNLALCPKGKEKRLTPLLSCLLRHYRFLFHNRGIEILPTYYYLTFIYLFVCLFFYFFKGPKLTRLKNDLNLNRLISE